MKLCLSRTPLTGANDFTSTKSRIIQLCLELTSTVQKVSEAQASPALVFRLFLLDFMCVKLLVLTGHQRHTCPVVTLWVCLFPDFDDDDGPGDFCLHAQSPFDDDSLSDNSCVTT